MTIETMKENKKYFVLFWYLASKLPRKKEHSQSRLNGRNDINEMSKNHFFLYQKKILI